MTRSSTLALRALWL